MMRHASIACSSAWLMIRLDSWPLGHGCRDQPGLRGLDERHEPSFDKGPQKRFFVKTLKNCDSSIRVPPGVLEFGAENHSVGLEWRKSGMMTRKFCDDGRSVNRRSTGCLCVRRARSGLVPASCASCAASDHDTAALQAVRERAGVDALGVA
jgi:hypothetical protein